MAGSFLPQLERDTENLEFRGPGHADARHGKGDPKWTAPSEQKAAAFVVSKGRRSSSPEGCALRLPRPQSRTIRRGSPQSHAGLSRRCRAGHTQNLRILMPGPRTP